MDKTVVPFVRRLINQIIKILELLVAFIILAAVVVDAYDLVRTLLSLAGRGNISAGFSEFLGNALAMVIGIEFVRMLNDHSPDLVIEVLIYAIGRHLIISHANFTGILLGVLSICLLFLVHHFILSTETILTKDGDEKTVLKTIGSPLSRWTCDRRGPSSPPE